MGKKLTKEEFVIRSNKIHNNKYDYYETIYNGCEIKATIICKKHGKFLQSPHSHLAGAGCATCGIEKVAKSHKYNTEIFIEKAKKIHIDMYMYDLINYINSRTDIEIICKKHGLFKQNPTTHLMGSGCPSCGGIKGNLKKENGWSYSGWLNNSKTSSEFDSYKIYIVEAWNDEERFIKIGRTFMSVSRRLGKGNTTFFPYNYKVLKTIEGSSKYIYKLEKELHKKCKAFRHIPEIDFHGMYECFKTEALNLIEEEWDEF